MSFRNNIIIVFLIVFFFQAIVYNLLLCTSVLLCKIEEKNGNNICLTLTKEEYNKAVLNESELLLNNNLYDLINVKKESNQVKVICQKDEKEKDLLEKIAEHLKKQSKQKKGVSFSVALCDKINHSEHTFLAYDKVVKYHFQSDSKLQSRYTDFTSPPPKS